jgi:hypothetical protein
MKGRPCAGLFICANAAICTEVLRGPLAALLLLETCRQQTVDD